jgi:ElaB/YqjD/DUF883 family membrane-anchored ribosome-binding protein
MCEPCRERIVLRAVKALSRSPAARCIDPDAAMPWLPFTADTQTVVRKAKKEPLRDIEARELQRYMDALEEILGEAVKPLEDIVRNWRGTNKDLVERIQREALEMRSDLAKQIREVARPYAAVMADAGAKATLEALADFPKVADILKDSDEAEANPLAVRAARNAADRMSLSVSENAARYIADTVARGIQEGATISEMADAIAERRGISRTRAEMIARTESAYAYSEGRLEAMKESGVVIGKRWLLSPDACEFCEAAGRTFGQKTIPVDTPFYTVGTTLKGTRGGTMQLTYRDVQGAPLHPNCRCDIIAVTEQTP